MTNQPTNTTCKSLLLALGFATIAILAVCDSVQAEEAVKAANLSGNTAKNRVSNADVSAPDKIPASGRHSPEADAKTQHECPTGISPAQTREQLVENMLFFAKNARHKGRDFYAEDNLSCYFRGEFYWRIREIIESPTDPSAFNIEEMEKNTKYYNQLPEKWGVDDDSGVMKITHILPEKEYEVTIYFSPSDNTMAMEVEGQDPLFDPRPILDKYFTDTEKSGYVDPAKDGKAVSFFTVPYIVLRREKPINDFQGIMYDYRQLFEKGNGWKAGTEFDFVLSISTI